MQEEVPWLLQHAEAVEEEDAAMGETGRATKSQAGRPETRIWRIRKAKRAFEEQARVEAESEDKSPEDRKPEPRI